MNKAKQIGLVVVILAAFFPIKNLVVEKLGQYNRNLELSDVRAGFLGKSLKRYHFGFANFLSALIWIDLLQRHEIKPVQQQRVSWEFAQLDSITTLDPNFQRAYHFGSIFLSVLRQDKLGAKRILEKWVSRYPHRWQPRYIFGYHLLHELDRPILASKQFLKAASVEGSPYWLTALGVRLISETGKKLQAIRLSLQLYEQLDGENAKARLRKRIRSLNYSLQKSAWTQALSKFNETHKRAPASLQALEPLYEQQLFEFHPLTQQSLPNPELQSLINERFAFQFNGDKIQPKKSMKELGIDSTGIYKRKKENKK